MDEVEAMQQIRQRMAAFVGSTETYVPVDAANFRHLDLAFYDRTQQALHAQGFALIGDYEIAELKGKPDDVRCFIRAMVSRDGIEAAALFHPKPSIGFRLLMRVSGKPLGPSVEIETEFSDDTFITNATPPLLLFDPPPMLLRSQHPAGTSVEKLLAIHRAQVRGYLSEHPGVSVRRVTDLASLRAMQKRQHDIKKVYREMQGGMSADELRRLGGFSRERAARLKRLMDGETPEQVAANPKSLPPFSATAAADGKQVSVWNRELSPRAIGIVLLVSGTGLGYLAFYLPWRDVGNHAPTELSPKAIFLAPLVLGLGLCYSLAPVWSYRVLGDPQKPTKVSIALSIALFLLGAVAYVAMKNWLAGLGYTHK